MATSAMRGRDRSVWVNLASTLHVWTITDAQGRTLDKGREDEFTKVSRFVEAAVVGNGGVWDAAVSRAVAARFGSVASAGARADASPGETGVSGSCSTAVRALRSAHALAIGRPDLVSPGEVPRVAAILARSGRFDDLVEGLRRPPPPAAPTPGDGPHAVTFRYAYRQSGPRGRGNAVLTSAMATAAVPEVAAVDAPVVASLRARDGTWIPLRFRDGGFLRPVFAPGSWRGMSVAEFSAEAARGPAWVDNPFFAPPHRTSSLTDMDDVCFDPVPGHARDAEARRAVEDGCLGRASRLVSVDGIVHVATGAPSVELREIRAGSDDVGAHRAVWVLEGDADALTSQDPDRTFPTDEPHDVVRAATWGRPVAALRIGEVGQLHDVMRQASEITANRSRAMRWVVDEVVRGVDEAVLPSRPDAVLRTVEALRDAGARIWRDAPGERVELGAWLDALGTDAARDGFPDPNGVGKAGIHVAAAMARVASAQLEPTLSRDADEAAIAAMTW